MPTGDIKERDMHDATCGYIGVTQIECVGQNAAGDDVFQAKETVDGTTGVFDPLKVAINK